MVVDWLDDFLVDGAEPAMDAPGVNIFIFIDPGQAAIEAWREHGARVLARFVRDHPGTRPWAWWLADAPEPRRRLGGTGDPLRFARLAFGVPDSWQTAAHAGSCMARGVPVDPRDPPVFESEATYLKRLALLTPAESKRLGRADFRPEAIEIN